VPYFERFLKQRFQSNFITLPLLMSGSYPSGASRLARVVGGVRRWQLCDEGGYIGDEV